MPCLGLIVVIIIIYAIAKASNKSSQSKSANSKNASYSGPSMISKNSSRKAWVPPGTSVTVRGINIPDGMVYVGDSLLPVERSIQEMSRSSRSGRNGVYFTYSTSGSVEPCLINPNLPITKERLDPEGSSFSYWPSYSEIPPVARRTYLEWLASGRNNPTIGIGYVFLFFYGIERRVLFAAQYSDEARREIPILLDEIERLISLYGDDRSFHSYARTFVDWVKGAYRTRKLYLDDPPSWNLRTSSVELDPPITLFSLSQIFEDNVPIPWKWAFAWAEHKIGGPRVPIRRCREEALDLFRIRYQKKYAEGVLNKRKLNTIQPEYRTASSSFGTYNSWKAPKKIPDPNKAVTAWTAVNTLFAGVCDDLSAYSRLLGRHPEVKGTPEASALLPVELSSHIDPNSLEMKEKLTSLLTESEFPILKAQELFQSWQLKKERSLLKSEITSMIALLSKWGMGLEPDVGYGSPKLSIDDIAVVFREQGARGQNHEKEYEKVVLLIQLVAFVLVADGGVRDIEIDACCSYLFNTFTLSKREEVRLKALLIWRTNSKPNLAGVKNRLSSLSEVDREKIAGFLVLLAGADGVIHPEEIKALRKLYGTLGLDQELVYSHIHELSVSTVYPDEPVTVISSKSKQKTYAIPGQPPQDGTTSDVVLSRDLIEKRMKDTEVVSALLSTVFEEESEQETAVEEDSCSEDAIQGLDSLQSKFVLQLGAKTKWERAELESLAANLGVPLDGSIEAINEVSWDLFDEPLIDIDDYSILQVVYDRMVGNAQED